MSEATTDRELLELAAKAAGIRIDKSPHNGGGHGNTGFDMLGNAVLDWHGGKKWNPLADDGDALRLAVKLGMVLDMRYTAPESMKFNRVNFWPFGKGAEPYQHIEFDLSDDATAATRRAITRAAAAIGREMK